MMTLIGTFLIYRVLLSKGMMMPQEVTVMRKIAGSCKMFHLMLTFPDRSPNRFLLVFYLNVKIMAITAPLSMHFLRNILLMSMTKPPYFRGYYCTTLIIIVIFFTIVIAGISMDLQPCN